MSRTRLTSFKVTQKRMTKFRKKNIAWLHSCPQAFFRRPRSKAPLYNNSVTTLCWNHRSPGNKGKFVVNGTRDITRVMPVAYAAAR
jgi:hypothetical protein